MRLAVSHRPYLRAVLRNGQRDHSTREGLLVVVELDVRLVLEGNVEGKSESAGRGPQVAEAGLPAVHIAIEADGVVGEPARHHVVDGVPGRAPVGGRLEAHVQIEGLLLRLLDSWGGGPRVGRERA